MCLRVYFAGWLAGPSSLSFMAAHVHEAHERVALVESVLLRFQPAAIAAEMEKLVVRELHAGRILFANGKPAILQHVYWKNQTTTMNESEDRRKHFSLHTRHLGEVSHEIVKCHEVEAPLFRNSVLFDQIADVLQSRTFFYGPGREYLERTVVEAVVQGVLVEQLELLTRDKRDKGCLGPLLSRRQNFVEVLARVSFRATRDGAFVQ